MGKRHSEREEEKPSLQEEMEDLLATYWSWNVRDDMQAFKIIMRQLKEQDELLHKILKKLEENKK